MRRRGFRLIAEAADAFCKCTHKIECVAAAIDAAGARVRFLPAYSPDLNPIEMAYSMLNTASRKGAARTVEARWKLVGKFASIAPDECANYFRHAGYKAFATSGGVCSSTARASVIIDGRHSSGKCRRLLDAAAWIAEPQLAGRRR